jgi:hypothetical protein
LFASAVQHELLPLGQLQWLIHDKVPAQGTFSLRPGLSINRVNFSVEGIQQDNLCGYKAGHSVNCSWELKWSVVNKKGWPQHPLLSKFCLEDPNNVGTADDHIGGVACVHLLLLSMLQSGAQQDILAAGKQFHAMEATAWIPL